MNWQNLSNWVSCRPNPLTPTLHPASCEGALLTPVELTHSLVSELPTVTQWQCPSVLCARPLFACLQCARPLCACLLPLSCPDAGPAVGMFTDRQWHAWGFENTLEKLIMNPASWLTEFASLLHDHPRVSEIMSNFGRLASLLGPREQNLKQGHGLRLQRGPTEILADLHPQFHLLHRCKLQWNAFWH